MTKYTADQHRMSDIAMQDSPSYMAPKFPKYTMLSGIVFSAVLFVVLAWIWSDTVAEFQLLGSQQNELLVLDGEITYLDEVLTMSSNIAVASKDNRWIERYYQAATKLDEAINRIIEIAPSDAVRQAIDAVDAANIQLVAMEEEAFSLLMDGSQKQAERLLLSPAYEREKSNYAKAIVRLHKGVQSAVEKCNSSIVRQISMLGFFSVLSILMMCFGGFVGLRRLYHWRNEMNVLDQKLLQTKQELEEQRYAIDRHASISMSDIKGQITYANEKFINISGYNRDELIGQNHRIVNSHHHDKSFWKDMFVVLKARGIWNADVCNQRKDGSLYWVNNTVVTLKHENGRLKGYISIRSNISALKQAEQELVEAKAGADAASEAKSEFLASMSHEIRTPMNGVLGMLGLLLNSDLNADQKQKAKIAQESARSLITIINDILDFSKVEAGKLELEDIDFNLIELLESIARASAFKSQGKGLEFILDARGINQPNVNGDPSRIRQIVTNLIGNSNKFTEQGEIVLKASLTQTDESSHILHCQVKDTGIGIASDKIDSLFDSFTQTDTSVTRKYGGTGLGLAISKDLVELMGGDISVTSAAGRGSCFSFKLKLKSSNKAKFVVSTVDLSQLHILVVDDNSTCREIIREQLEHWGAKVFEADSAEMALKLCAQHGDHIFDLALLDLHMPEIDGDMLARSIRSYPQYDEMKILLMASLSDKRGLQELRELGISACLAKPVLMSELCYALSEALGNGVALEKVERLVTCSDIDLQQKNTAPALVEHYECQPATWPSDTRILLVEDNRVNQIVAKGILAEYKLPCDVAGNGLEALEMLTNTLKGCHYTLIFMDCQMPELDGYAATQKIRQGDAGQHNQNIPIIAMTANAMEGDKEKCLQAGMNDYITKPIAPAGLLLALNKWLLRAQFKAASLPIA